MHMYGSDRSSPLPEFVNHMHIMCILSRIKELRDSKLIVVSVFSISVISVVDTVIALLPINNPDAIYGVLGGSILILATGVLVLLFVTRVSTL